jgi:hypothetical protein
MSNVVVSRFNEENLELNRQFRDTHKIGCLYGTAYTLNQFNPNEVVFVVEMNLTSNRVEGVGLILNIVKTGPQYNMYGDYNYNRYIYCGKYRLDRTDLEDITIIATHYPDEDAEAEADQKKEKRQEPVDLLYVLDNVLFKGKSHMKRGSQLSRITDKLLLKRGVTSKKVQDAIIQAFIDKYHITISMEEELNYELYGL